jgi:hypothetical protein
VIGKILGKEAKKPLEQLVVQSKRLAVPACKTFAPPIFLSKFAPS